MKAILNRYLYLQVLTMSITLGSVLIAAIWILQSLRFVEMVLSTKSSMWMFAKLAFLSLPELIALVLPIAVFISTLVVLNRLLTEREFAVMQSSGVSRFRILVPFLQFGIGVMIFLYMVNIYISPLAQSTLKGLQAKLKNALPAVLIQEGVFNEIGKMVVYVKTKRKDYLKGVFVSTDDLKNNSRIIIAAQEGHLITDQKNPQILLFNGTRQTTDKKTGKVSSLFFNQTTVSLVKEEEKKYQHGRRPQEMPFLKLLFPKSTYPLAERLRLQAEAHQKILTPLLVLVLILIGGFCLMRGQFSRKGLLPRIIYAVCGALGTQGSVLFLLNQSAKFPMAVVVNYVFIALLTLFLLLGLVDLTGRPMRQKQNTPNR